MIKGKRLRAASRPGRNMKRKRRGLPPNVTRRSGSRPDPPSKAAILQGLKLMRVFLTIESGRNRKTVLDFAKQLALSDANAKT
jgi:hypothetical protein